MTNSPLIFDRKLIAARAERARSLGPATFLLERAANDLVERLAAVLREFPKVLDLGTPTDAVRKLLKAQPSIGTIVAANVSAESLAAHGGQKVIADEEILPFGDASFELVVSVLAQKLSFKKKAASSLRTTIIDDGFVEKSNTPIPQNSLAISNNSSGWGTWLVKSASVRRASCFTVMPMAKTI